MQGDAVKSEIAYLSFSLDVTCPYCEKDEDISDDDSDGIIARAIFNNNWHELEGYEVTCTCGETFLIEKVEY